MNQTLASNIKRATLASGWYQRKLANDRLPGVAVLSYHGIRPDGADEGAMAHGGLHVGRAELESHCRFIRDACHAISLDDWRTAAAGGAPLPPRPVLVTFDDGYRSVFTVAKPILERYRIPAAVFLCTQPIAERTMFWHDSLAMQQDEAAVEQAKRLPETEWDAVVAATTRTVADEDPHAPLRVDEVKALADHPLFEIGAHTVSHPVLKSMSVARQQMEIARSQDHVREWTGRAVRSFAYPNGRPRLDYTDESVAIADACGIDFAFTTGERFAPVSDSRLECPRFVMLHSIDEAELAHRLSYSWRKQA